MSVAAKSIKATTTAPAGDSKPATAAPVKPEVPMTSQELTPDMTSDNPLETRNLAFYTQKITEGALFFILRSFRHVFNNNILFSNTPTKIVGVI